MKTIDYRQTGEMYVPYWKTCVGAGRANEGLRFAFQKHLQKTQREIGFRYLRFHGLLHDDMFVARKDEQGKIIYNFQYIDDLYDAMLENHIRPFVELSFFPSCLKGGDETVFWWKGNITPPEKLDAWCELIENLVRHWLRRYGEEEVHQWYFEVWNEPNLYGFWHATKSQYFELYAQTARTIKRVDPALRVGGPATSNFVPDDRFDGDLEDVTKHLTHRVKDLNTLQWHGVWIEDFLAYCAENNLPVDFVSAHPYPTDFALDTGTQCMSARTRHVASTEEDLRWMQKTVRASAYPHAEIHLTEWSSSPSPRDCTHDYLQEAAYIVKCNLDGIGLVDSLSYWTFTDVFEEGGAGDSIFHGGFGLLNYQGIVKPGYHAYRMLSALGNELLYRDENAFFTRKDGKMQGILYHYPITEALSTSAYPDRSLAQQECGLGEKKRVQYRLEGLTPGAVVHMEVLDHQHGWALPVWQQMGCPEPPTREQTALLREAAEALEEWKLVADENGVLTFDWELTPWSVLFLAQE